MRLRVHWPEVVLSALLAGCLLLLVLVLTDNPPKQTPPLARVEALEERMTATEKATRANTDTAQLNTAAVDALFDLIERNAKALSDVTELIASLQESVG